MLSGTSKNVAVLQIFPTFRLLLPLGRTLIRSCRNYNTGLGEFSIKIFERLRLKPEQGHDNGTLNCENRLG